MKQALLFTPDSYRDYDLQFTIYDLQFTIYDLHPFDSYYFLFRRMEYQDLMKLIPPCHEWYIPIFRELLRHKDAHQRF